MSTINGLPVHPLVVHLVVVLLPLAALAGVAVALVPALRRRFGILAGVLGVAAALSVPAAMVSGNWLYDHRLENLGGHPGDATEASLIEQHKDIAVTLWPWAVLLAVGVLATVVLPRLVDRISPAGGTLVWLRVLTVVAVLATVAGAAISLELVIRIGEAGAKAAWSTR